MRSEEPVVTARASGRTAGAPTSRSCFAATVMVQPVSMRSSMSRSGPVSWLSASRRSSGTVSACHSERSRWALL